MEKEKAFPAVSFAEFEPTSYEAWKKEAVDSLKGGDFDKKLKTPTYEGITLEPIYTKADVEKINMAESFPGAADFLRSTTASGYLAEPWAIAQAVRHVCPKEANKQILHELEKGADAVNVKIGAGGTEVKNAEDMKALFAGVDLSAARLHVSCDCVAGTLKLMEEAGLDLKAMRGMVGADPVGTLAATGKLCVSLSDAYDSLAEAVKFAAEKAPGLRTVLVDGNVYANGGASAVDEVAACLSTAALYMEELMKRGVSADAAAGSIRIAYSLGANFFMEIAKLRASRVVFAQMAGAFGADKEAQKIDVFAKTSEFTQTVYDPYVNILRATTQAFSGVVGGVNAMEVLPLDAAIGAPDDTTKRIARNIQVMLQEEFNLLEPIDPAGGSWYVETLTAEVAKAVWEKFQKLEAEGGIVAALKAGTLQAEIAKTLESRFANLAKRSDRAVGNNMYANMTEKKLEREPLKVAPACDKPAVETVAPIEAHRWTERFEELRAKTEKYEAETGKTVDIFLANMGPIPQHKARADFACGFFEVGHFNMLRNDGFKTVEEAAKAAVDSGAPVAVICSTDATYPELVPPLAKAIKAARPEMTVMLAGAPAPEFKQSYLDAGVDEFIHVKANCYDILSNIQRARGIR